MNKAQTIDGARVQWPFLILWFRKLRSSSHCGQTFFIAHLCAYMLQRPTVFWADDDAEDVYIINKCLEVLGHTESCLFFSNGFSLIEALNTVPVPPGLIIVDLNMPQINGAELVRLIKSDTRFGMVPVVVYSTSTLKSDVDKCLLSGACKYVVKPMRFNDCVRAVAHMLTFSRSPLCSSSNPSQ